MMDKIEQGETEKKIDLEFTRATLVPTGGTCPLCGKPALESASLCLACDSALSEEIHSGAGTGMSADGLAMLKEIATNAR